MANKYKRWCKGGCRKQITGRGYLCAKCSKKTIMENGLGKKKGQVVYGLYDTQLQLVYVGVTNEAQRRVSEHAGLKKFYKMELIERFETRAEADAFEIFAIWHLRPPMNKKVDEPNDNFVFDLKSLDKFGKVSDGVKPACDVCGTILSMYTVGTKCRRHSKPHRTGGARKGRKKFSA